MVTEPTCSVSGCLPGTTACIDRGFTLLSEPRPTGCARKSQRERLDDVQDRIDAMHQRLDRLYGRSPE